MANVRLSATARNAMLNALRDRIDAGGSAGQIRVYDGAQPANSDAAVSTQTLLAVLTFSYPCAPDAALGVLTFSPITEDSSANASGTATWARLIASSGTPAADVDVGTSGATINLNTTSIESGGPVRLVSGSFTIPGA